MNKYIKMVLLSIALCYLIPSQAEAADVEIKWMKPENYKDIHPGKDNRKRFHKRLFNDLGGYFEKLAETMPVGYKLRIIVADLDLAGNVTRAGMKWGSQLKMVRKINFVSLDAPKMVIYYDLVDESGTLLLKGGNELKRQVTKIKGSVRDRSQDFAYEKIMIDDWFKTVFINYITK